MLAELKKLIEANPLFRDKLNFPTLRNSRLRTLINQRYVFLLKILEPVSSESNAIFTLFCVSLQFKLAASAL